MLLGFARSQSAKRRDRAKVLRHRAQRFRWEVEQVRAQHLAIGRSRREVLKAEHRA
ncbi:MAG TPA: hypothetical protein VGL83_08140 [Stellaceae bacterium]